MLSILADNPFSSICSFVACSYFKLICVIMSFYIVIFGSSRHESLLSICSALSDCAVTVVPVQGNLLLRRASDGCLVVWQTGPNMGK